MVNNNPQGAAGQKSWETIVIAIAMLGTVALRVPDPGISRHFELQPEELDSGSGYSRAARLALHGFTVSHG